jgi:hypothetical protein
MLEIGSSFYFGPFKKQLPKNPNFQIFSELAKVVLELSVEHACSA